jgi:hypothetical protein
LYTRTFPNRLRFCQIRVTCAFSDEGALEQAHSTDASYIVFVAGKVNAEKILDFLRDKEPNPDHKGEISRFATGNDIAETPY